MRNREPLPREESDTPSTGKPPVRLFLRMPEANVSVRPPSRLARIFALDVYSSLLLTTRTRREMNLAAVLLLIVSLFELGMWTALFNFIYNSNVFYHGPKLIFAALTAVLFATVIFYFERQMIVHDDIRQGRASKAMAVRAMYVLVAAFITSQPFDLIIFDEPIRTRIHEEEVRRNVLTKFSGLERLETELAELSTAALADDQEGDTKTPASMAVRVQTRNERERLSRSVKKELLAQQKLSGYNDNLRGTRDQLNSVQRELRLISKGPVSETLLARQRQMQAEKDKLLAKIGQLQANLFSAQIEWTDADQQKKDAITDLSAKKQGRDKLLAKLSQDSEKYKAQLTEWVRLLNGSKPGDKIKDLEGWAFEGEEKDYDFLQKLRVFYDLFEGRTPRWEGGKPAAIVRLRNDFNLYDPQPCNDQAGTEKVPCDAEEWARHRAETWVFRTVWLVCLLIAVFIPFLILTIKRYLFPEDLRIFYSRLHQAQAGEPEASLVTRVDEYVRHGHHGADRKG